jgi:hypothetical protein
MRRKKGTFPFFLWIGETISKRMMPANPVCGTNIKEPELAVKGTPQKQLQIP